MREKEFIKGTSAMGEALIRAGCTFYCGYPITPSSELLEYMSWRMPQSGGIFLQVESEIAAINMVEGAAATGRRVATASSGPGISLMQEGISYMCGAELPCVIINVCRDGPALGGISASQTDYFQSTRGGGHGGYRTIVIAPSTAQEAVDIVVPAFDLAEKYRIPVLILTDAMMGQAYEVVNLPPYLNKLNPVPPWALTGARNRPRNLLPEFFSGEKLNLKLIAKHQKICEEERRFELFGDGSQDLLIVAYGTAARVCRSVVRVLSEEGIQAGLFRPVTLYPFPYQELKAAAQRTGQILVVEMSQGQMIEDIKLAVEGQKTVEFYGRVGGIIPMKSEILSQVRKVLGKRGG